MIQVVSAILLLLGVALILLAGAGLIRFPDVFARMHAATKAATLGLLLVLIATGLQLGSVGSAAKLSLVGIFMFITAPVGAHMVGRAAYRAGEDLASDTTVDELAGRSDSSD
ncbi:MAG: monovalent cation/H(+) antiporter subunit G [Actinomycetota bacterium]